MRIKKNDTVRITRGADKGKVGKVMASVPAMHGVLVEGIGLKKRHIRPNQLNPRGGTKDIQVPVPIANVALVVDATKGTTSRVGYSVNEHGQKIRQARSLKNKEIK